MPGLYDFYDSGKGDKVRLPVGIAGIATAGARLERIHTWPGHRPITHNPG
jgi:hypothetical protein